MRPADYSEEQIIEAGKALQEEGKRVTPFGIRERMGGGKPQRIREIWEQYVAGDLEQEARQEDAVELPAEFAEQVQGMNTALIADLTAFATRVYRRADEIAESRTREAMQAAKKAKESAETDVAEAERVIEDQDAQVEALEQQIAALREELSGAKRDHRRVEEEKAKEITALTVENTRLGEQVKTAQELAKAAVKALETAVTERERDQSAHERDRERWEKDSAALQAKAEQERLQWEERLGQEKELRDGLHRDLESERNARREAEQQVSELKTGNARLEERARAAETRAGEMKEQFAGLQQQLAEAVTQTAKPRRTRKKAPAQKAEASSGK